MIYMVLYIILITRSFDFGNFIIKFMVIDYHFYLNFLIIYSFPDLFFILYLFL